LNPNLEHYLKELIDFNDIENFQDRNEWLTAVKDELNNVEK